MAEPCVAERWAGFLSACRRLLKCLTKSWISRSPAQPRETQISECSRNKAGPQGETARPSRAGKPNTGKNAFSFLQREAQRAWGRSKGHWPVGTFTARPGVGFILKHCFIQGQAFSRKISPLPHFALPQEWAGSPLCSEAMPGVHCGCSAVASRGLARRLPGAA